MRFNKTDELEISKKIDELLLEIYPFMPSTGSYPFTMIRIKPMEISKLPTTPGPLNCAHILVVRRADFGMEDLIDYVMHSKEYSYLQPDQQAALIENYRLKYQDKNALDKWAEQIISLGIGMLMQLARQKEIDLKPMEKHLIGLDSTIGFSSQHLQVYQLLIANPI